MANEFVQTMSDARVDARSLSEFVFKPAGFKVARRLAPTIDTLQFYIDRFDATKATTDAYVATIPTIVNNAINNTAVEGGVLADTFVTATANGVGTIARTQRDINAESVSIHSFGECGNGAEDTAVFNLAMSTLSSLAKADGKPRVLRLIAGKTYNLKNAIYYPLVDLVCADGMATLRRVDVPEGTLESVAKWWRILDCASSGATANWNSDLAYSHRCNIRNIVFDGNKDNARWSGMYQQEQSSCLFIAGKNVAGDKTKRVKFQLDNVSFKDSVSDGLHIQFNSDVIANNIQAERCFRGGFVSTGGNAIIRVNGWVARDARFDCEIDAAGTDGTMSSEYYISNYYQDMDNNNGADNLFVSGIDFGGIGQGGTLVFDNVHVGTNPFNWIGTASSTVRKYREFRITRSSFVIGAGLPLQNPLNMQVKDTNFIIDNRDRTKTFGGLNISMSVHGNVATTETVALFDNIRIKSLDADTSNITNPLIILTGQTKEDKKLLKVINSDLSDIESDGRVFSANNGTKLYVDNIAFSRSLFFYGSGVLDPGKLPLELTIGKLVFKRADASFVTAFTSAEGDTNYSPLFNNSLTFLPSFEISAENNKYPVAFPHSGNFNTYKGFATIVGKTPPTSATYGYKDSVYKIQEKVVGKPYEWINTKHSLAGTVTSWRASRWLVGSFATADLPVLTAFDVGTQNIDTTLNKVVTWSGTAWV